MPKIRQSEYPVHSVLIQTYSSVEGDALKNNQLHHQRALTIKKDLGQRGGVDGNKISIESEENWELMRFQLEYFGQQELALLTEDSLRYIVESRTDSLPWDSLLFRQRKATASLNYWGRYDKKKCNCSIYEFNLQTALVTRDVKLANRAMYEMYHTEEYDPAKLFTSQMIRFIKTSPQLYTNYLALLSQHPDRDVYHTAAFMRYCLGERENLDEEARINLLHLYTKIGVFLLRHWDVPASRLANILHPDKLAAIQPDTLSNELMLNLNLTFIQYFNQVNDYFNVTKSFGFIVSYFNERALSEEDEIDLVLFFNRWSMYKMTVSFLSERLKREGLGEEGLFILAQTMNYDRKTRRREAYLKVHDKALAANLKRWCDWIDDDFQILRDENIKQRFCDHCKRTRKIIIEDRL